MARGGYKVKRGGGRSFSKHLELDENGTAVASDKWARRDKGIDEESEEGSEAEDESEESESEADDGPSTTQSGQELTRAERRELKKKKAEQKLEGDQDEDSDQDPILANPNVAAGKKLNISDLATSREPTRREREEKEKKDAKERYWKLHEQGKTEQAKADLARLAKIRADREAAQAKRKAEAEAKTAELEAKKREAAGKGKRV